MDPHGTTRSQYLAFARECVDSPSLVAWSTAIADDPEVLAWIDTLPGLKRQPNLVFAAARWHGVTAPGPYEALRTALLDDDDTLRSTILSRSTQTNEARRSAVLLPAFAQLADAAGAPVALVEVGASAGLCLYPDRWSYRWTTPGGDVTLTGPSPHELSCTVSGPAPLPDRPLEIAWRGGIDLHPLDVTDPDAMAWLETLIWPEHDDRRATLRAAVEIARAEPPTIMAGDLLESTEALVAEAGRHGPVIVFHTAVIAYLTDDDRERFHTLMVRLVAEGACHWVSNEGAWVLPRVASAGGLDPAAPQPFVVGIDGVARAHGHGHGRELAWF